MSIACRFYKLAKGYDGNKLFQRIKSKLPKGSSFMYKEVYETSDMLFEVPLKIYHLRNQNHPQIGNFIVLMVDLSEKIMDYEEHGEDKVTVKRSYYAPILIFNGATDGYIALLMKKGRTTKVVQALNKMLAEKDEKIIVNCAIDLNEEQLTSKLKRFWVGQLQDEHSKSASVAGSDLKNHDDWERYVNTLSGVVNAGIYSMKNDSFELGLSRDGSFWIKTSQFNKKKRKVL